jgi:Fe-S cluster assembly iron-binding protein IscA
LPVRVELKNSGCCDAVLGLRADTLRNPDLTVESDGVIFLISPETYQITGDVTISYVDRAGRKGFMMTSSQHVSEWDGFAVTEIEI